MAESISLKRIQKVPPNPVPDPVETKLMQRFTPEQTTALEHLKVIYPQYQDPEGLIGRIIKVMTYLQNRPGFAFQMPVSATRNRAIFITLKDFHIVQKTAGKGTQSTAYFTVAIPLDGGDPKNQLIKTASKPFDPEVERLERLSPASKLSSKIDHFMGTYGLLQSSPSGTKVAGYIAIFNASSCDLCHVDYNAIKMGGHYILRQLIDILDGIASFHRANIVLRDIKGANLLCNPWNGPGKVTDFGLVRKLAPEGSKHDTALTPKYAAPYIWESILGQKYRMIKGKRSCEGGFQGKAADVFAFGRTLQLDVINFILRQYGQNYHVFLAPFVDHLLIPETVTGSYSDEELLAFERVHPGRVFHVGIDANRRDVLHIFKEPEEVYRYTLAAIEQLKDVIQAEEYLILKDLSLLAKELQNPRKEGLISFLEAEVENEGDALIQGVKKHLVGIREAHSLVIPFDLSKLEAEENVDVEEELDGSSHNTNIVVSYSDSIVSDVSRRREKQRKALFDDRDIKRVKREEEGVLRSQP
ncbi:MAG: hypothetical protein H7A41_07055 [Chlamydiales bacterium]|nr:hypothetical protein [Chlamydiales bacterium]